MRQAESATRMSASERIQAYEYPAGPDAPSSLEWNGWGDDEEPAAKSSHESIGGAVDDGQRADFDRRLAEETRRSFEAGRERGRQEGRQTELEAQAAIQAGAGQERARQTAELIEKFFQERDRYLQNVEPEVVKLALAVSARILRREAQMDPLLLSGAVRVALGQLAGSTQVKLRVPPTELDLWCEAIALLPKLAVRPAVIAGEGMRLGDCVIETEMGSVDLGIRAQLSEIERGFFDRAGGSSSGKSKASGSGEDAADLVGAANSAVKESRA